MKKTFFPLFLELRAVEGGVTACEGALEVFGNLPVVPQVSRAATSLSLFWQCGQWPEKTSHPPGHGVRTGQRAGLKEKSLHLCRDLSKLWR